MFSLPCKHKKAASRPPMPLYRFDTGNFRNCFSYYSFNDALKSELSARAAVACALETYSYDVVRCKFYEFDISAVSLKERLDFFDAL